jgi:succinate dehydrogenase / fumarate reductase cytochrome b subunit
MSSNRTVGLLEGSRYRGGGPMLSWLLHRVSGLGSLIFVGTHVAVSFLGGSVGRAINDLYEAWWFQIFVFFCILYHALNGLRIILLDFFPSLLNHQREAIWTQWLIFLPAFGVAVVVIIRVGLGG